MIHRRHLTGEEIFKSYLAVAKGYKIYEIAKNIPISRNTLHRQLTELNHLINGGNMRIHKGRGAMLYALAKVKEYLRKEAAFQRPKTLFDNEPSVYEMLNQAIEKMNTAIESVIVYEVDRRTEEAKKELAIYKEAAKKSNLVTNLKRHFNGVI